MFVKHYWEAYGPAKLYAEVIDSKSAFGALYDEQYRIVANEVDIVEEMLRGCY